VASKLNKSYEREPIEVQMRALRDKKKDLESKIDAFLDEAARPVQRAALDVPARRRGPLPVLG